MILVTTPTGKTGSLITQALVEKGHDVRVLARYPEKLPASLASRVDIVKGSLLDVTQFTHALLGCVAMYFCVPETFTYIDVIAEYEKFATVAQQAIKESGVQRVVYLSGGGMGTHLHAGTALALHRAEDILTQSGAHLKALRCPVFFESLLYQLAPIRNAGMFFLPFAGDFKAPQVAVRDIAQQAVRWLVDTSWSGISAIGVHGAADISYNEMAATLSDVLQKPIRFQNIPRSRYIDSLVSVGSTVPFANALVDMYEAIQQGLYTLEPRTAETTTPTTFRHWAVEVFLPLFNSPPISH